MPFLSPATRRKTFKKDIGDLIIVIFGKDD